jgi:hypothetical protein
MSATALPPIHTPPPAPPHEEKNYLNATTGLASWLLTVDHKRICILYLIGISVFFAIGGFYAMLVRLELLTPAGDMMTAENYNRSFTMHGIAMVFFFLIPSIPATLGNFLVPIMCGARDLAFPKINLMSWYCFMVGAIFALYTAFAGGVDTGWTFYTPVLEHVFQRRRAHRYRGRLFRRLFVDSHRPQFYRHHPQDAGAGTYLVQDAAVSVGDVLHQRHSDPRHADRRESR